jgi:hypothetical protein
MNRVRLNGRFGDHRLAPGTYVIVVVARRGERHSRVGRISIQVVPPGSRVRRPGAAPVFRCVAPAAQTGIPGAGLFVSPPSANRDSRSQPSAERETSGSGVLAEPPFHIGTGSPGMDTVLAILLYGTLGLGSVVFLAYLVKAFRNPTP